MIATTTARTMLATTVLAALLASGSAHADAAGSYAEDRAQIENLMGRYIFALDWRNPDVFVSTFAEDGVLNYGGGEAQGHEALWNMVNGLRESAAQQRAADESGLRPARGRHAVSNIVITVDGDTATGRAYWTHFHNNNDDRAAEVTSYGHYEDDLVRVDGQWLFSRRHVFNEQLAHRAGGDDSPVN